MKKNEIEKIFKKLDLKVRSTGHNYGWLIVNGKKILRVHYSHGKGDIPEKVVNSLRVVFPAACGEFVIPAEAGIQGI